jgi:hypothetical protein
LEKYLSKIGPTAGLTRKEVAMRILEQPKDLRGVFFAIYDKKDLTKTIWLKLYPPFEKPFNANDDENNYDK